MSHLAQNGKHSFFILHFTFSIFIDLTKGGNLMKQVEARTAWVYQSDFPDSAAAEAYLRPMAEAGLNLIFPPPAGGDAGRRYVDAAHRLGIEVHPIVHALYCPPDRPDLLTRMPGGRASGQSAACPSQPEVRQHNIGLMLELLRDQPEVDGIHLDWIGFDSDTYHGTVQLSYCYCAKCRDDFQARHGADPLALVRDTKARPDLWAAWVRFRCDVVNAYARDIRAAVKGVSERLSLSATAHQSDGAPDILHEPYVCSPNFQEWGRWMAEGIMDFFCPMPYTVDNASFRDMLNTAAGAQRKAGGRSFAYPGIGIPYLIDHEQVREQILACRQYGLPGFSIFHADSPIRESMGWWKVVAELCGEQAALPHRTP